MAAAVRCPGKSFPDWAQCRLPFWDSASALSAGLGSLGTGEVVDGQGGDQWAEGSLSRIWLCLRPDLVRPSPVYVHPKCVCAGGLSAVTPHWLAALQPPCPLTHTLLSQL